MNYRILVLSAFAIVGVSATAIAKQNPTLAIVGATIIDGTGGQPISNGVIVVENGKITAVGREGDLKVPAKARRIDWRGKYVIPGLIDTNVHVSGFFESELFALYTYGEEDPYGKYGYSLEGAQEGLKYGVTTMLDTYGPLLPLMKVRDRINSGEVVGPRLLVAGNIIGWGGPASADQNPGKVTTPIEAQMNKWFIQGTGVDLTEMYQDDAVKAVQRYMDLGPDFIKIGTTSHHTTTPIQLTFSPNVHKAMVDAAHARNMIVVVHSGTVEGHRVAVASGVNIITHADLVNQEFRPSLIEEICKSSTFFAPFTNLSSTPEQQSLVDSILNGGDADNLRAGQALLAARAKVNNADRATISHLPQSLVNEVSTSTIKTTAILNQRHLIQGGCKIVIATDSTPMAPYDLTAGRPPFYSDMGTGTLRAIEGLVQVGMSPKEALISATRRGAEAIGLGDKIGTLQAGKVADLVVLDDDPLRDIANIHKISDVMHDGVIIDRKALPTKSLIYHR